MCAVLITCAGNLGCLMEAQDQPEQPPFELRVAYLQAAGLQMPSYMPGVLDVMNYQLRLATHQELTIEWHLIPGEERPVRKESVSEGSLAPNFTLVEQKHGMKGGIHRQMTLQDMTLVTAAVTSAGEVRGLAVGPGSPATFAEHFGTGGQSGGHDLIAPRTTLDLYLPDDPKIEKLIFLLAHPDGDKYRFERVGVLQLPRKRSGS